MDSCLMGSVSPYDTAAGRRWRVRYRTPGHAQTDKRGFKTKRESELFLASTEVSKARGEYIETSAARKTVGELGAVWLADQTHLKASALDPVQRAWRLYVEPRWGSTPLAGVKHSDVQSWVSGLSRGTAATGHETAPGARSASVVLRAYGILAAVLDVAVRDRRIANNPARGVALPRKGKKARIYLTHGQVQLLAEQSGDHGALVLLLAYTGLRWGEAVALRVRDVDALRRRVHVRENAVRVGGHIVVGTPKTHETRSVPYPAFLEPAIAHECEGKPRDALVFGRGLAHMAAPDSRSGWLQTA